MQHDDRADALERAALDVADEVMASYARSRPELMATFDSEALAATRRDIHHHIDHLVVALRMGEPALFDDYLGWAEDLFIGLGLPMEWLVGSLVEVGAASVRVIGPEVAGPIVTMIDDGLSALPDRPSAPASSVAAGSPLAAIAVHYIALVLDGRAQEAVHLMVSELESGREGRVLLTQVLAPAQAEVGRLWQTGRITVAQEHVATSIAQLVMREVVLRSKHEDGTGRRAIVAAVGDELHDMGGRMLSGFFELAGWDAVFVGANTPVRSVVDHARRVDADVIALSCTYATGVPSVVDAIEALRAQSDNRANTPVIVGGRAFSLAPSLWERVGADGWAPDAAGGVRLAASLAAARPA
ncbi:MAG: cobalamin-dependent protein [Coriobacteriia bacterium]|nr:cobalamin-dependent protein [Coriobacteriia bacterium]